MKSNFLTKNSRQTQWLSLSFFIALATFMTGCATVPDGLQAMKEKALSFSPPSGKAGVYVIREFDAAKGGAACCQVELDNNGFGSAQLGSYLYGVVSPGNHVVRIWRGGNRPLSEASIKDREFRFSAEAGRNYFFTLVLSDMSSRFYLIPAIAGQEHVQKIKFTGLAVSSDLMD